jgi:hypothetical protein
MTNTVIEVFIERGCSSCARVTNLVEDVIRDTDASIRTILRETNPQQFSERNVVICPATFINGKLAFYGEFSAGSLKKRLQMPIINSQLQPTTINKGVLSMRSNAIGRAVLAGLAATAVMTIIMLMAPLMGMPEMNIGKMLGGFMGVPTFIGWAGHFMIGVVLAIGYGVFFEPRLNNAPVVRGILYGLIPWIVSQVIMNPMMGAGLFASNTPAPFLMVMGSLLGHVAYGAVLGVAYTRSATPAVVHSH